MILRWNGIRVTILIRNKLRRIRIRPCNDTNTLKSLLHSQFLPKYTKYVSFSTFFLSRFTSNNAHAFKINWILTHRPEVQVFKSRWKREFKFSSKNIQKIPKMTKTGWNENLFFRKYWQSTLIFWKCPFLAKSHYFT